jgi:hypothetical protein
MPKQIEFSEVTLREKLSTRGGGIEIDLSRFGFKGGKMSAYQNYLGGGMLGKVCCNDSIRSQSGYELTDKQEAKLDKIAERLKKHFHTLNNNEGSYEENQKLSNSAY